MGKVNLHYKRSAARLMDKRGHRRGRTEAAVGVFNAPFSLIAGHLLCLSPHGDTMDAIHLPAPVNPETTPPFPFSS